MTSFNSIALNGSTLSVNGTDYNLSLSQTAEGTDSSLSSFKGVAAVDNGDGTISLTVGENSVVVEKYVAYPTKGDLITMTLGNAAPAAGTNNTYRVLSISGSVAEVVAMFDPSTSQKFNPTNSDGNAYSGSSLDTYLNTTWYGSLNATAKAAIIAKNVQQYRYSKSSSAYNATTHASYANYSTKATKGSAVSRNVYALDVEDIEQYFGGTFSTANILTMFYNTTSAPSTVTYPWLRSALADYSDFSFCVNGSVGSVHNRSVAADGAARPAFTIDLSKIEWSKV